MSDNGIGIPVDMRERVFDSFARAHADSYAGQGLGLAICRRVVERHGGRIWVAEPVGSGTTVAFTLPLPLPLPLPQPLAQSVAPPPPDRGPARLVRSVSPPRHDELVLCCDRNGVKR